MAATACGRQPSLVEGRSLAEWRAQLGDEDPAKRVHALRRMASFGHAADAAVAEIARRLEASGDSAERSAATDALVAIGTPVATDAVRALLASPDTTPAAFAEAAVAGAALLPEEEFDRLVRGATVEQAGATLLADRTFDAALPSGPRRVDVLLWLAADSSPLDARTEDALVRRLAELGPAAAPALPFLARALDSRRGDTASVRALIAIGDAPAARALCDHLGGADPARRAAGMAALGALLVVDRDGTAVARAALHGALASTEPAAVRRAAVEALGEFGGPPDLAPLAALLIGDPLATTALDATIELVQRDAITAADAHAAWDTAIRSTDDPARARQIVRAFLTADRAHADAAVELARLAADRPELTDAILAALQVLSAIDAEAAWSAEAQVLADLEAARGAELRERFLRRLEQVLLDEALPKDRRAAAARRLAEDAPDRAVVPIQVDDRDVVARLRLGPTATALAATAVPTLHVPPGPPPIAWEGYAGAGVVWLDEAARRTVDRDAARYALTLPAGATSTDPPELHIDAELLRVLGR